MHQGEDNTDVITFSMDTKAIQGVASGSTFRVMMYYGNDRGYRQTGTYYLKEGVQELVAAELGETGEFIKEDPTKGINGVNDRVNLVLVSPGVRNNEDGSFDFNPDDEGNLLVTAPDLRTVGGYGPVRLNKPLYEPRSRISFEFYKKQGVKDFTVIDSEVSVVGVHSIGETVRIYPALRQVKMKSDIQERKLQLTYDRNNTSVQEMNGYELFYSTDDSMVLKVASGVYAPRNEAIEYLEIPIPSNVLDGEYIYMSCVLKQDNRDVQMRMPLNDRFIELKPQFNYVYKVLVESDYINIVLDIYDGTGSDWETGGTSTSEIGTLSETIHLGRWVNDGWQSAGEIDFTIG